ncbi:glycoside hydrolase family 61 protein [Botryobasidium botryosum FD-172 SS1]|uniref:AA9 family lytic polysaccharide monooxygenase n=1 Tax=Botryobasidium botryosum (strain FD-172 SS1) TaxID=930990 RepID=A0A067NCM0_BOTB1|nr:glycoside hydrolase family 61 protein [Botryobasidium botryosum FD-172 SS1]
MKYLSFVAIASLISSAHAHTYVWSVWVNGVDQGTGVGIREPAYNGPPLSGSNPFGQGSGFSNGPVRDINSIDLRCNVLGDIPDPNTIKVKPGDVVTAEWHHETRANSDDIIDGSHKGAGLVYISPDPPTQNTWVKIQEEGNTIFLLKRTQPIAFNFKSDYPGENPKGTWYVTGKHSTRKGKQDVQIPSGLAPGFYLLRFELLTLHEAEVSHADVPNRGLQFYVSCVQIEVTGSGTTKLPAGVSFPGAYSYSDPGIIYNVYYQPVGSPLYQIPGPAVWSGAAPSPAAPKYGEVKGVTTAQRWSTWIGSGFSTATAATSLTIVSGTATVTKAYKANWPSTYVTPTTPVPPTSSPTTSTTVPSTTHPNATSTTTKAPTTTTTSIPSGQVPTVSHN